MQETRWLTDAEMAAWQAYLFSSHMLERRIEDQLKQDAGLTHTQYEILVHLSDAPDGRMRMTELAHNVVTSKSAITYQINQMERAGLVDRATCEGDDRGVLAVLTPTGRGIVERTAPGHVDVVRDHLVDLLSASELQALTRIMRKVRASLEHP